MNPYQSPQADETLANDKQVGEKLLRDMVTAWGFVMCGALLQQFCGGHPGWELPRVLVSALVIGYWFTRGFKP